jgi:hypothetical protein
MHGAFGTYLNKYLTRIACLTNPVFVNKVWLVKTHGHRSTNVSEHVMIKVRGFRNAPSPENRVWTRISAGIRKLDNFWD